MLESIVHQHFPSPLEIKQSLGVLPEWRQSIDQSRKRIEKILGNSDPQWLLVMGPCSIHRYDETIEYAHRLKQLADHTSDVFHLVMRVNFEKPRTSTGWKGMLHDPDLSGQQDVEKGIFLVRKLMLEIASIGLPMAAELLDPMIGYYLGDLLSWGWIGSRTSESQIHRQIASGFSFPIGFKNSTDGTVESAVYGVKSASSAHSFLGITNDGKISAVLTQGNPNAHIILRGGKYGPNFDPESQQKAIHLLKSSQLPERLMIDCSHDNSYGDHRIQPGVFTSLIHQIQSGNSWIRGLMLESHLLEGKQEKGQKYGISITDACLGWKETEELIMTAQANLASGFLTNFR